MLQSPLQYLSRNDSCVKSEKSDINLCPTPRTDTDSETDSSPDDSCSDGDASDAESAAEPSWLSQATTLLSRTQPRQADSDCGARLQPVPPVTHPSGSAMVEPTETCTNASSIDAPSTESQTRARPRDAFELVEQMSNLVEQGRNHEEHHDWHSAVRAYDEAVALWEGENAGGTGLLAAARACSENRAATTDAESVAPRGEYMPDANVPTVMEVRAARDDELRRAFLSADVDHSGALSKRELYRSLELCGFHFTPSERLRVWIACDTDANGQVEWEEFRRLCRVLMKCNTAEQSSVPSCRLWATDILNILEDDNVHRRAVRKRALARLHAQEAW